MTVVCVDWWAAADCFRVCGWPQTPGGSSLSAIQLAEWREQEQKGLLLAHNFYFEIKHNRRGEGKETERERY